MNINLTIQNESQWRYKKMKGYTNFAMGFLGPKAVATKPIGKNEIYGLAESTKDCR